jgi:hypothetical protein
MPSKLLGAISPAYGMATGTSPYRDILGSYGKEAHDAAIDKREAEEKEKERLAKKERDLQLSKKLVSSSSGTKRMKAGGRVRPVDGMAIKGKTKGRFI